MHPLGPILVGVKKCYSKIGWQKNSNIVALQEHCFIWDKKKMYFAFVHTKSKASSSVTASEVWSNTSDKILLWFTTDWCQCIDLTSQHNYNCNHNCKVSETLSTVGKTKLLYIWNAFEEEYINNSLLITVRSWVFTIAVFTAALMYFENISNHFYVLNAKIIITIEALLWPERLSLWEVLMKYTFTRSIKVKHYDFLTQTYPSSHIISVLCWK